MKPNSNQNITSFTVDPTTQQITSLEVNGEAVETAPTVDLEDNKAATINVSTYTQPVEVIPTEGKDGMKKATITLSNIPVLGNNVYYSYLQKGDEEVYAYVATDKTDLTQAAFFYFGESGEVDPGDKMQTHLIKITPTNVTSDSFTYRGATWTVREY